MQGPAATKDNCDIELIANILMSMGHWLKGKQVSLPGGQPHMFNSNLSGPPNHGEPMAEFIMGLGRS